MQTDPTKTSRRFVLGIALGAAALFLLSSLVGSLSKPNPPKSPMRPGEVYRLSDERLQELIAKADAGDKAAAVKLVNYYRFYKADKEKARRYKAISLGEPAPKE